MTKTERKAVAWIFGGRTGSSSLAMCQFFLIGGEWRGLARAWDRLEALYASGKDDDLYKAIRKARSEPPKRTAP